MSLDVTLPRNRTGGGSPPPPPAPVEFRYTQTESFVDLLAELGASLLVSTYQANKLLVVRSRPGGLSTLVRTFERPMGIAARPGRFSLGTQCQVWTFRDAPDIAPRTEPAGTHDACYLPRSSHVTGDVGVHELAWVGEELWLVATRFSCLCTLDSEYSFVPRWRPPFVTALAAEDRCHLNGIAVAEHRVRYATALGATDGPGGWRAGKAAGGVLLEVPSGEVVIRNLSMPHSPRVRAGQVWLLESGTGRLLRADAATGQCDIVAEFPGFARGLAIRGDHAFIGLSKIRGGSAMDGVPLAARRESLKCGVGVVDLRSGETVGLLEFQSAVEEVFDVQLLADVRHPEVLGFQKDAVLNTFVVPPGACDPPQDACSSETTDRLEENLAALGGDPAGACPCLDQGE